MYAPQGLPAVCFSVLASSIVVIAAVSRFLPPCIVPALGLCVIFPEFLSDALFFRRCLLGLLDRPGFVRCSCRLGSEIYDILPLTSDSFDIWIKLCRAIVHPRSFVLHLPSSVPRMLSRRRSGGTTPESAGRFPAAPLSFDAGTETQALRRSEMPLVQIVRFVRGEVYP